MRRLLPLPPCDDEIDEGLGKRVRVVEEAVIHVGRR